MAIKFKFARIADNINNTESKESEKESKRKANVRPVLLSDKTIDKEDLVKLIIQRHPQLGAQAFLSVEVVLEALKKALQDGNIIHLKDFGQFSLKALYKDLNIFCNDRMTAKELEKYAEVSYERKHQDRVIRIVKLKK